MPPSAARGIPTQLIAWEQIAPGDLLGPGPITEIRPAAQETALLGPILGLAPSGPTLRVVKNRSRRFCGPLCGLLSGLAEKSPELPAEALDVEQEGVVTFDALQGCKPRGGAGRLQRLGHRALLRNRKEEVGFHADDQRLLEAGLRQHRGRVPMGPEVEPVHCPGEV